MSVTNATTFEHMFDFGVSPRYGDGQQIGKGV